jgi:hypothetical protein
MAGDGFYCYAKSQHEPLLIELLSTTSTAVNVSDGPDI